MKKTIKKILLGLVAVLAAIVAYAAFQPADYTFSREIVINAPAEKIFPYLNSSRLAMQWGPWADADPQAKMEIQGPESGVGSKTSWTGGKQLGTGSATIVESIPNQLVGIALDYVEPMAMTQRSDYLLKSDGQQTTMTWRVQGKNSLPGRIMCLFVSMDKMMGQFFEQGLAKLKGIVENGA